MGLLVQAPTNSSNDVLALDRREYTERLTRTRLDEIVAVAFEPRVLCGDTSAND